MDVPAWAFSNLCLIGRTYDSKNNRAGIDIFPQEIKTRTENVNRFSFQYKFIESKEDVRDLLNISGAISLKIKANIFKVEGAGKYINNNNKDEGVSEILAVVKCTTVNKTMDGTAKANDELINCQSLGTHYVRSVTYGAEMVASLKFKSSSSSKSVNVTGKLDGGLDIAGIVTAGLEAELNKLTSDCNKANDLSIEYYATDLPDKNPTNLEDLVKLIQEFPSRLRTINDGLGVPIKIELQPIENVYPNLGKVSSVPVHECDIDEIECRFDDLNEAQRLVSVYITNGGVLDGEMKEFRSKVSKILRTFRSAISSLEQEKVTQCLEVYEKALSKEDYEGKFAAHWRELLKKKEETETDGKAPTTDIKLPSGKDLTVVLLGKTGNGKSATGNTIIGKRYFTSESDGLAVTQECEHGRRSLERSIFVIDTPGVLYTAAVKRSTAVALACQARLDQEKILTEVSKIFALAPRGFDAFLFVARYGSRLTGEDEQALRLLTTFLGNESLKYTILVLTYGDQTKNAVEEQNITIEECCMRWVRNAPEWMRHFVDDINERVVLFNNMLREEKDPEGYKKQLTNLINTIDKMNLAKSPFINSLTDASKEVLEERIKKTLDSSGFTLEFEQLKQERERLRKILLEEKDLSEEDKSEYENLLRDVEDKIEAKNREKKAIEIEERQEHAKKETQNKSGGAATKKVKARRPKKHCSIL